MLRANRALKQGLTKNKIYFSWEIGTTISQKGISTGFSP